MVTIPLNIFTCVSPRQLKSTGLKRNSSIFSDRKMYLLPCAQSQFMIPVFSAHSGQMSGVTLKQGWQTHNICSPLSYLPCCSHDIVHKSFIVFFPAELVLASGISLTYSPQDWQFLRVGLQRELICHLYFRYPPSIKPFTNFHISLLNNF